MANSIKISTLDADAIKVGSSNVTAVYVGSSLVWSGSTPTPPSSDSVIEYTASSKLLETATVLSGGLHTYAFSGTSGQLTITSHTFSNGVGTIAFNGDVKRVGSYAFFNCSGATSITIPSSVSVFDNQPFWGCTSLTDITIKATAAPTFNGLVFDNTNNCNINVPCNSLVDYASVSMFYNYGWLSRLKGMSPCTNKVRYIDSGTTCNGYDLYQVVVLQLSTDNGSTWSYVSPAVTQEYLLEENSQDCGYTPIGNGITYEAYNQIYLDESAFLDEFGEPLYIESHTFDGYQGTIIFNADIAFIGDNAFNNNYDLVSITIPNSVTSIGSFAFDNCGRLHSITIYATTPPSLGSGAFDNSNDCPIFVPSESYDLYQFDEGWSTYHYRLQRI